MKIKLSFAAILFAASLMMAFSGFAYADGCSDTRCSLRSDYNTWCCSLNYETASPNACTYYNDTGHCYCDSCYLELQ
jgi:hypothetical protein